MLMGLLGLGSCVLGWFPTGTGFWYNSSGICGPLFPSAACSFPCDVGMASLGKVHAGVMPGGTCSKLFSESG